MTEVESRTRALSAADLPGLRVGELRRLAASLGIRHTHLTRKAHLVEAISNSLDQTVDETEGTQDQPVDGGQQPADQRPDADQPDAAQQPVADQRDAGQPDGAQQDSLEPATDDEPAADQSAEPQADEPAAEPTETSTAPDANADAAAADVPTADAPADADADRPSETAGESTEDSAAPKSAASHVNAGLTGIAEDLQELQRRETGEAPESGQHDGTHPVETDGGERQGRRGRGRGRGRSTGQTGAAVAEKPVEKPAEAESAPVEQPAPQTPSRQQNAQQSGQQRDDQQNDGRRGRYRDRKRRTDGDEPEIRDDDVLIPIAGILDVLDNYAFVRTSGYLSGANDVYVSLGQVKKYHLRRGDAVVGSIRQLQEGEQPPRQKYNALVKVDSVNGLPVAEAEHRTLFDQLTPLYPQERLRLETEPGKVTARLIDVVAPIGKGQRGLVVSPPRAGKTLVLQAVAAAIAKNNPEVHLMVVLVDERPEEVTEMQRTVKGEVIASTFDRPAEDHATAADLAIERAKRLVELGYDVVVLLDSLTRLGRAHNQVAPQSGRMLPGGVDAAALHPTKRFFGAARNIENGGSLTIIATALVETGSKTDEAILEEFSDAGNAELRLSGALADKRIFPAIDVLASGTRREELLMGPDEVRVTGALRRALAGLEPQAALETVLRPLTETDTNVEFLVQLQKSLPSGK